MTVANMQTGLKRDDLCYTSGKLLEARDLTALSYAHSAQSIAKMRYGV